MLQTPHPDARETGLQQSLDTTQCLSLASNAAMGTAVLRAKATGPGTKIESAESVTLVAEIV
jgi:hypothetical protein